MSKMEFSVSDAKKIVNDLQRSADTMQGVQKKLTTRINQTHDWWVGDAGDAFIGQYEEFRPSLEELEKLIISLSTQMENIADVMVKYDQEGAKRYR